MRREDVLLLEELNFNAWPALRTVHYDGWLLRSTGGTSRRVNSVNCLWPGVLPLEEKIAAVIHIYARWGRRVVFRLTPLADEGLDALLERQGHPLDAPTFVQVADAAPYPQPAEVQLVSHATRPWIEAATDLRALSGEDATAFRLQHVAIGIETGWARISDGQRTLALGVVGVERGWAGLHGIYVAREARRHGLARLISQTLVGFAYAKGARRVWLQVEQGNAPAIAVYAGLGFATAYAYHHRLERLEQRR